MEQSKPHITYTPRPDATPEAEISALANVYAFIIDCAKKKRGRLLDKSGPERPERVNDDPASARIVPE